MHMLRICYQLLTYLPPQVGMNSDTDPLNYQGVDAFQAAVIHTCTDTAKAVFNNSFYFL